MISCLMILILNGVLLIILEGRIYFDLLLETTSHVCVRNRQCKDFFSMYYWTITFVLSSPILVYPKLTTGRAALRITFYQKLMEKQANDVIKSRLSFGVLVRNQLECYSNIQKRPRCRIGNF